MKMPSVTISFTEAATAAVKRGERGIIAMILKISYRQKIRFDV